MNALQNFFAMGGYGGYIWPAYLAAAGVLGALTLASVFRLRRLRRDLALIENEQEQAQ